MLSIIKKNILANYISKFWGFVSVFIFVPYYIQFLGVESYAIISFQTVLLTFMFIADAGLTTTLSREMARTKNKEYLGNLLYTTERVYLVITSFILLLIWIISGYISNNWLHSEIIKATDIAIFISLMGVSIVIQLFSTLYIGSLMGLEKQVLANGIQIFNSLFRSGIILIPLYFYPSLYLYFIWQIIMNFVFVLFTRYKLWTYLHTELKNQFNISTLKNIWKFALSMMMLSIIYSLNTQIDKLFVSKMLTLTKFGYYSLAATLSQVPVILTLPIATAILPKMTVLSEANKFEELRRMFHKFSFLIAVIATTSTVVIFSYTQELVMIWTQNNQVADAINKVTKVLIIGGLFFSFQLMPYHLAIAKGYMKVNVRLGIVNLLLSLPLLYFSINAFGMIGAGFQWLLLNFITFTVLGIILIPKFLKRNLILWLFCDTFIPLISGLTIGVLFYLWIPSDYSIKYLIIIQSCFMGVLVAGSSFMLFNICSKKNKIF